MFSIDFAGPFLPYSKGNRYVLIAVEHFSGWPLACSMADASADEVIKFVTEEIMHIFGAPRLIISDNATCFTATKPIDIMKAHGIKWKTVLACAPMSTGRA